MSDTFPRSCRRVFEKLLYLLSMVCFAPFDRSCARFMASSTSMYQNNFPSRLLFVQNCEQQSYPEEALLPFLIL